MKLRVHDLPAGGTFPGGDTPLARCPMCRHTAIDVGVRTSDVDGKKTHVYVHEVTFYPGGGNVNVNGVYTDKCLVEEK